MNKPVNVLLILCLVLCAVSCKSTPDAAETVPEEDEKWVAEDSGLDGQDDQAETSAQQPEDGEEDRTERPQNEDSIASLENERIDDLFDGSELPIATLAPSEYRTYNNTHYGYRAAIPSNWYINEAVVDSTGVTKITRNAALISVTVFKPARGDRDRYEKKAVHELERTDATFRTIISEREIRMYSGSYANLMVHEYTKERVSRLRRTIVLKTGDTAYIIRCEAPTNRFYTEEAAFNTFVRTFQPLSR